MNENTNESLMNGENEEQELERLRAEVEAEMEQDIAAMPPDETPNDAPLPEPPPEKKKQERELPDWMVDKLTINEMKFCKMFTEKHPLKCIGGRFYDYDGLVDENALGNEIYRMLRQAVWFGLPKKVTLIMDTLRHYFTVNRFCPIQSAYIC